MGNEKQTRYRITVGIPGLNWIPAKVRTFVKYLTADEMEGYLPAVSFLALIDVSLTVEAS